MSSMRRRGSALLTATIAFAFAATVPQAGAAPRRDTTAVTHSANGVYVVRMAEPPAAGYTGGVAGYKATKPAPGRKLDATSPDVKRYAARLDAAHKAAADSVGATRFYDYHYAFNGFAAKLTPSQVRALSKRSDVAAVDADALARIDTVSTPRFLGLTAQGGLWEQLGGTGQGGAGENVVIGVVDTGIWPEHPSFSDQTDLAFRPGSSGKRSRAYGAPPATWHGTCQSGEQWSTDLCNNKLIGARYFLSGYGHWGVVQHDFKSARDYDSHGSHTASTAGGNHGVDAKAEGQDFGEISGMAPRARIAAYKVCWNGEAGGCPNTDSVAAIDAAVADGVDVINFSISGTRTSYLDPVEVAFLFAEQAGVSVATSAGNEGPGESTVAHVSPWLSSVAASTHDRNNEATVTLGNGATYSGPSQTGALSSTPLVLSSDAALAGADPDEAALCYAGALDPAKVAGKVVVCDRGVIGRVEKGIHVEQAGGVGMILVNTSENSVNGDLHVIPTVHLDHVDGAAVKAYASTASDPTAALSAAAPAPTDAPQVAAFSSRGPSLAGSGDLLKPDMTAPGVDIIAAVSPVPLGRTVDFLSGTSMSSPHVAGLLALLRDRNPGWSPSAYKSSLMTTGRPTTEGTPLDYGAGHVTPNDAADPGLVYQASFNDYRGFLRGQGLCTFCFTPDGNPATAITASDLNLPTIAVGKLAGARTVTRRVTNVGTAATYTVSVEAPPGVDVSVDPPSLTLGAGESASFTVTMTSTDPEFDEYAFGSLTWSDGGGHAVRSAIAVKPVALAFPDEVTADGTSGSEDYDLTFGYSGPFNAVPHGLIPAVETAGTVADDPTDTFDPDGLGVNAYPVTIPAGTRYARFALFDEDTSGAGADDLDIYLYKDGEEVASSAGGTASETISAAEPEAGDYVLYVHGWQPAGPTSTYTLYTWLLGDADAGNLTVVAPAAATLAGTATASLAWTGLTAGTRYLGAVGYDNGTDEIGQTIVRVDT